MPPGLVEIDEEGDGAAAVAGAEAVDEWLDRAEISPPRLYHAGGIATWAVLDRALGLGRDVRVGLEDTLALPDGRPARDNAELVRAAAALVAAKVSPSPTPR